MTEVMVLRRQKRITAKSSFDEIYSEYSARYDERKKTINLLYGATMEYEKANKAELELALKSLRSEDRKASVSTLVNRFVREQSTEVTVKQAEAFSKILKEEGAEDSSFFFASYNIFPLIQQEYKNLRANGKTSAEADAIISDRFFGS